MKIAILGDSLDLQQAGIHQYTRQFVEALVRNDQENEYLLIRFSNQQPIEGMENRVVSDRISAKNPIRLFYRIPKIIQAWEADAVFEPAHFGPFNLPASIKRITMVHDLTPMLLPQFHPRARSIAHRMAMPRLLKKAQLVLTNSEYTRSDIEHYYPFTKGKVRAIHLGRDPFFIPKPNSQALEKLGVEKPYLLSTGTIEPRKNLLGLLEAFTAFKANDQQNVKLVIAGGKGWKSEAFYQALENHPHRKSIVLAGFVSREELRALYSDALALVYPSWYEGFGIPLVEAMSCGCPAIVSDRSSLPEVGGQAVLTASPNDIQLFAKHMLAVSTNPNMRNELVDKALKRALDFDWDRYVQQWQQMLQTL